MLCFGCYFEIIFQLATADIRKAISSYNLFYNKTPSLPFYLLYYFSKTFMENNIFICYPILCMQLMFTFIIVLVKNLGKVLFINSDKGAC